MHFAENYAIVRISAENQLLEQIGFPRKHYYLGGYGRKKTARKVP
ncbi:MAG: hypothetical protein ACKPB7_03005 [Sphaerospermopsis kisseleviana]